VSTRKRGPSPFHGVNCGRRDERGRVMEGVKNVAVGYRLLWEKDTQSCLIRGYVLPLLYTRYGGREGGVCREGGRGIHRAFLRGAAC